MVSEASQHLPCHFAPNHQIRNRTSTDALKSIAGNLCLLIFWGEVLASEYSALCRVRQWQTWGSISKLREQAFSREQKSHLSITLEVHELSTMSILLQFPKLKVYIYIYITKIKETLRILAPDGKFLTPFTWAAIFPYYCNFEGS